MGASDSPDTETPAQITRLLAALHSTEKGARARAGAGLAAMGPAAVDPLVATLRDPRWEVRYRAAEALGQIRDPRVCRALLDALEDTRDHVRYMAAKGLGLRRCAGAVPVLCRALGDENEFVRRIAAVSLGSLGDPGAVPFLENRLEKEESPAVREAIVQASRMREEHPRA